MRVVKPIEVTDSKLTSATIPEPDVNEVEWSAGTYLTGQRVIKSATHRVYEVVADPSTTDDPEDGILASPPSWVEVGPTNRWAMFDTVNSTKSEASTQLVVEITNGQTVNSVSGFAIEEASNINVTVTDPVDGIVFDEDVDMLDNSAVSDWYYYYFSPIININQFTLLDLPAYPSATVKVTIDGNDIAIGSLVLGNSVWLGVTNYGSGVQLLDFSKKEQDDFGNIVVTPGRTSKLVTYDISVPKDKVNYVFSILSSITTTPSVWVGDESSDDTVTVFGYYRDYQNNISSPSITDATIQVEGLV